MLITNLFSAEALRDRLQGELVLSTDEGYDAARQGWNLAADLRPAMVAQPACAEDVSELVIFARENGLRVVMQGTGHNATPLGDMDDVVLVRTGAMRGVEIDPVRRVARVEAGAVWADVAAPGLRARPRGPRRLRAGRRRRRLRRRRRARLARAPLGLACRAGPVVRRRHGRRPARPRRSRQRARPLLGAARRRRLFGGVVGLEMELDPGAERDRRHDALRLASAPARSSRPGASGRPPPPRRRPRRAGSCRSPTCRRSPSSCAGAAS